MKQTNEKKRTLRENSAIRHFTREFVGDFNVTCFSIYSYIFMFL